jgi:hypothetical protein
MVIAKDWAIKWKSDWNVEKKAVSFVAFRSKKLKINSQCSLDTAKKKTLIYKCFNLPFHLHTPQWK